MRCAMYQHARQKGKQTMRSDMIDEQAETKAQSTVAQGIGRGSWAPYLAEGIGTFGLVFAGCGAIMIDRLSGGQVTHVGVGLVFGLIITVMIYALGHISGAHFNPASPWVLCWRGISRCGGWLGTGPRSWREPYWHRGACAFSWEMQRALVPPSCRGAGSTAVLR